MAQLKKLLHIDMIVDASIGWDVLSLVDGKAMNMNVRPVKHGGQDEETGELKAAPTGKEIVLALAGSREQFTTTELNERAESVGVGRPTCAAALYTLMREGIIKRLAPMTYGFSPKAKKAAQANGAEPHPKKRKRLELKPDGIPAKIMDVVRQKQNGSGEGVSLKEIRGMLGGKKNISPLIYDLLQSKRLVRVGHAAYRVGSEA